MLARSRTTDRESLLSTSTNLANPSESYVPSPPGPEPIAPLHFAAQV